MRRNGLSVAGCSRVPGIRANRQGSYSRAGIFIERKCGSGDEKGGRTKPRTVAMRREAKKAWCRGRITCFGIGDAVVFSNLGVPP